MALSAFVGGRLPMSQLCLCTHDDSQQLAHFVAHQGAVFVLSQGATFV